MKFKKLTIITFFIACAFLANAQQFRRTFPADVATLDSLQAVFQAKWKADSLRLLDAGLPLVVTTDRLTISFIGYEDNNPIYVTNSTQDEVLSYYGNQLWAAPYNVTGTNFLGMWEAFSGNAALPNPNDGNLLTQGSLPSRVYPQNSGFISSHANNVAIRMAGDGTASPTAGLGIAKTGLIAAWDIDNLNSEMSSSISSLLVSNHSYGEVTGWTSPISWTLGTETKSINWLSESNVSETEDYKFGRYGTADYNYDALSRAAPYHAIVKSAGNDRGDFGSIPVTTFNTVDNGVTYTFDTYSSPVPEADGGADGYDCLPQGSNSKNAFVIGSCNNIAGGYTEPADVVVSSFSSFGPTDDGRIKPDFVAPGPGGTSYAAPNVSGAILLLQEINFNQTGSFLKAASIKALLAHTAYEAGTNAGPDYKHGWGLINPKGAADLILDQSGTQRINEEALANGETDYYLVYSDGTAPLTATINWLDPAILPVSRAYDASDLNNSTSRLVNDLDMRVVSLADVVQASPYILDPTNPDNAATTGDNFRDNIEKIEWTNPTAGWYAIRVSHKGTLSASQDYSLVISGVSQGACAVEALPTIQNTYDGTVWSTAFSNGQSVSVEGNLTLTGDATFADVLFSSGVTVTIPTSNTLTITGNVWSFADVTFAGDGIVRIAGTSSQNWCGGGNAAVVEFDNSTGATLGGAPLAISDYLDAQAGTLSANGSLLLSSSVGNYAQIHESGGQVSGRIQFQQTVNSEGWHTIAAPVSTTLGDLVEDMTDYVIQLNRGSVYFWNATSGEWENPADTTVNFGPTNPYQVFFGTSNGTRQYSTIPFTINLSGVPTSGPVNNTVVYGTATTTSGNQQGWNLLANPYPENLSWTTISNNFGALNITPSYYIWDASAGQYKNHDGTSGDAALEGYIAPGQAFFVKLNDVAAEATTAFDFSNANRSLTKADFLKQSTPQLILTATAAGQTDAMYVAIKPGASTAFNGRQDSYKLFSPVPDVPQVYISEDSATGVSIKYYDLDEFPQSVEVAYKNAKSGPTSMAANLTDFIPNMPVFLEDKMLNIMHDLRLGAYNFNHNASQSAARFVLHIGKMPTNTSVSDLMVWGNNGMLNLALGAEIEGATVTIYNAVGAQIYSSKHATLQNLAIPFSQSGVYIIAVAGINGEHYSVKWVN